MSEGDLVGMDSDQRRTRLVLPIAAGAGVVVAGICVVAGMAWLSATLVAVAVLLVGCLALLAFGDGDPGWPESEQDTGNDGARREVARLSWAMHGKDSRVETRSARRLQTVATARLAERGLDLADPADEAACVALVGRGPYEALRPDLVHPPHFDQFTAALTAVERLHPSSSTPTPGFQKSSPQNSSTPNPSTQNPSTPNPSPPRTTP